MAYSDLKISHAKGRFPSTNLMGYLPVLMLINVISSSLVKARIPYGL